LAIWVELKDTIDLVNPSGTELGFLSAGKRNPCEATLPNHQPLSSDSGTCQTVTARIWPHAPCCRRTVRSRSRSSRKATRANPSCVGRCCTVQLDRVKSLQSSSTPLCKVTPVVLHGLHYVKSLRSSYTLLCQVTPVVPSSGTEVDLLSGGQRCRDRARRDGRGRGERRGAAPLAHISQSGLICKPVRATYKPARDCI